MEWAQCFLHTLYPIPEARRAAERSLSEAAEQSNYGLALLRLVAGLSVDEQTSHAAATAVNFTDVQSFFENIITPELQSPDVNSDPTLKAGSLKFLTMFRSHLPKPFAMQLFPELVRLLKSEANAVHSCAALCIEKLLLVKEYLIRFSFWLSSLVELNRGPISPDYMQIFLLILSLCSWNISGDVPALVRLLERIEYGVRCDCTVHDVWIERERTAEFQKSLVVTMSLFLVKHGPANLVDTMNAVQPNIFTTVVDRFWIHDLKLVVGAMEVKLAAVAATRLVCETPDLLVPVASRLWGAMVNSIVTLVSRPEQERAFDDEPEDVGYTGAAFVNLYNVGRREVDPLEDMRDPKKFLVTSLATLSAAHPGRFPLVIRCNLEKANQDALIQLGTAYNCEIV
ncbi:hypothetical protein Bca4012_053549 [Brassica carinata]